MRYAFDASAALALLLGEDRGEVLRPLLANACIGSVNLSEAIAVLIRHGSDPEQARLGVAALSLPVIPFSELLAIDAGMIWPSTKAAGSSLGDCAALALCRQLSATLLTTDRQLSRIAQAVGVVAQLLVTPGAGSAR